MLIQMTLIQLPLQRLASGTLFQLLIQMLCLFLVVMLVLGVHFFLLIYALACCIYHIVKPAIRL